MLCNFCNKKIDATLTFINIFSKPKLFCDDCQKIININKNIVAKKYIHYYFANYNNIKNDIYNIKYFGKLEIIFKYKKLLNLTVNKKNFDIITIAPSNNTRKAIRGFNHVEKICSLCNIKISEIFYEEYREKQAKINKKRILTNFRVKNDYLEKIKTAKNILIIDDIFTTGKTLISLANALQKINDDAKITFLTLAKTL